MAENRLISPYNWRKLYNCHYVLNRTETEIVILLFRLNPHFCFDFSCCEHGYFWTLNFRLQYRSSHPEVFLRKGVMKIRSKFTGEHPCLSAISHEIALRHGYSPVNLLHIFRTPIPRNTSGGLWNIICVDKGTIKLHKKAKKVQELWTYTKRQSFEWDLF